MAVRAASRTDVLTLATLIVAAVAWIAFTPTSPSGTVTLGMALLLAVGVFAVDWWPLPIDFRGQSAHTTLSGLAVILGILFVGPIPTALARVLAGGLALRLRWRLPGPKLRFNAAMHLIEVWTAATTYQLIAGDAAIGSLPSVIGIVVAVVVTELIGYTLVLTVIRIVTGPLRSTAVQHTTLAMVFTMGISALSSVTAAGLLHTEPVAAAAFGAMLGLLIASNRSRHLLAGKHRSLSSLYAFMGEIHGVDSVQDLIGAVLREAQEVTGTLDAAVVVAMGTVSLHLSLDDDGHVATAVVEPAEVVRLASLVGSGMIVEDGRPRPCPTITGGAGGQLLITPLAADGVEGVMLFDGRRGSLPRYDADDLALAAAVARHAGVALRTSRLLDQLRIRTHELERSALHDPQTGLLNVEGMVERISSLQRGTVVVCQLLDLEMIDAAFGHGVSSEVAVFTADRLRSFADGSGHVVGRIGPGRFAMVMDGIDHRLDAREAIAELRASLSGPIGRTRVNLEARFAFAAALAPEHGTDVAELLRRALNALLEDRPDTRGDVAWFGQHLDTAAAERLELASDLRDAIEHEGLSLVYQPKVDLGTGRIVGVEALARWAHPTRGYVPPDEFIDIAERTGLIRPLTIWVAETAIAQAAAWQGLGVHLTVAINLSTVVMEEAALARRIIDCCATTGLPGDRLILEITESQMMGDMERGSGIMAMFDAAGMQLSVDDFGTGYSSLAQLKSLPVDEVKIDRGFITNLASNTEDRAITEAIIRMARSLHLQVVAEGIEDDTALALLQEMGCHVGQGYALHRPMPAVRVSQLLAEQADLDRSQALRFRREDT